MLSGSDFRLLLLSLSCDKFLSLPRLTGNDSSLLKATSKSVRLVRRPIIF